MSWHMFYIGHPLSDLANSARESWRMFLSVIYRQIWRNVATSFGTCFLSVIYHQIWQTMPTRLSFICHLPSNLANSANVSWHVSFICHLNNSGLGWNKAKKPKRELLIRRSSRLEPLKPRSSFVYCPPIQQMGRGR